MITEAQRRALFALREALHLCNQAHLMLALNDDEPGMTIEDIRSGHVFDEVKSFLGAYDIDAIIEDYPE